MQMNMKAEFKELNKLLANRGLEEKGKVQKYVDNAVIRYCSPYVPMSAAQGGTLKDSAKALGGRVEYQAPYAKFLYYGKVMVSPATGSPWARKGERKVLTDRDMVYNGGPQRGPYWFEQMKANHGKAIAAEAAAVAGGRAE